MTPVDFDSQMRLLLKLASEFPQSMKGFTITWSNDHADVGVYTHRQGACVFFNGAEQEVATLDNARDLLRGIFEDEVVAVTAYEKGKLSYSRLAPAADPAATLPTPSSWTIVTGHRYVPDIDDIVITTWNGGAQEPG
jgi:hypothetical protein